MPGISHKLGILGFWLSTLSYALSDWLRPFSGGKAYLYYVGFPLSVLCLLFCGTTLRGCRTKAGKLWLLLMLWMVFYLRSSARAAREAAAPA